MRLNLTPFQRDEVEGLLDVVADTEELQSWGTLDALVLTVTDPVDAIADIERRADFIEAEGAQYSAQAGTSGSRSLRNLSRQIRAGITPIGTRPERIPGRRRVLATGNDFTWGPVEREHVIGERILIVEYLRDMSRTNAASYDDHGKTLYHVEVDGRGSHSFYDFDEAVIFAIATARTGDRNAPAVLARHFIAGLGG